MFRTGVRRLAATAWRATESLSKIEAGYQHGIEVSKAQGIAKRGLVDGRYSMYSVTLIG